jgi:hypothetical protein
MRSEDRATQQIEDRHAEDHVNGLPILGQGQQHPLELRDELQVLDDRRARRQSGWCVSTTPSKAACAAGRSMRSPISSTNNPGHMGAPAGRPDREQARASSRSGARSADGACFRPTEEERDPVGGTFRRGQAGETMERNSTGRGQPAASRPACLNGRPPSPIRRMRRVSGCSSMVEQKLPKLTTGVRFPSPAPFYIIFSIY